MDSGVTVSEEPYIEEEREAPKLKLRARHCDPSYKTFMLYPPSVTARHPLGNTSPCVTIFNPNVPVILGSPASRLLNI